MNFTFNKNSMAFSHRHQMVNFSIYSTKKKYTQFQLRYSRIACIQTKRSRKGLNISKMTLSHFLTCFEHNGIIYVKRIEEKTCRELSKCFCMKCVYALSNRQLQRTKKKNCKSKESMTAHILCGGLPVLLTFGGHCVEP